MNNISDLVSNSVQSTLQSFWNNWVNNHPLMGFFISHPITAIIILIVIILTIWGIIQQIPSLLVNLWFLIFKSPFIVGKSLLSKNNDDIITQKINANQEELLKQILTKLESIEKEQITLKKELEESKLNS